MARSKPWLKMWKSWQHDPDMLQLTAAEAGIWWRLYTLAAECDADGRIVDSQGRPIERQVMLDTMHITSIQDTRAYDGMVKKRTKHGAIRWDGVVMVITSFHDEQMVVPSDHRGAIRERVNRFRHKASVTPEPLHTSSSPVPLFNTSLSTDKEEECNELKVVTKIEQTVQFEADSNDNAVKVTREFRANDARVSRGVTEDPLQTDLAGELWSTTLAVLKGQVTSLFFSTYFEESRGAALVNNELVVSSASFERLNNGYRDLIEREVASIAGVQLKVRFQASAEVRTQS